MSVRLHDLMPLEIRHPQHPQPINFAFRARVDPMELRFYRSREERELLFDSLKRDAAAALAQHIAKHCKWFDRSCGIDRDMSLQLELTISDRGAYENWLPREHAAGRREGWDRAMSAATASLPHGIADAATEFYE